MEASNITFSYEGGPPVVRVGALRIKAETIVTILGPSGCGKTTFLKLLSGIETANSRAAIRLAGFDVRKAVRSGLLSFSFQAPVLMPWRDVFDNVRLPVELRGRDWNNESIRHEICITLGRLGLEEQMHKHPEELSSGMSSRVSVAQAMLAGASIHFMDEVFGTLDEANRVRMNLMLRTINLTCLKSTILFVTHSIDEAILLGDRVLVFGVLREPEQQSIRLDIPVNLPPRNAETRYAPEFLQLKKQIEGLLPKEETAYETSH